MAVESKRGCGYRKVGGLYLVSSGVGVDCGRFPIPCEVCPCCSAGIKQARGWTWVQPGPLLSVRVCGTPQNCALCPFDALVRQERAGLLWIGERFYPTPAHFALEADSMGVSRRIQKVPRNFKLGETWVLFGHPKGYTRDDGTKGPAIVFAMRPTAIEKIVTESQAKDAEAMAALAEKGITPVAVPDDDRDHQGSAYDDDLQGDLVVVPE